VNIATCVKSTQNPIANVATSWPFLKRGMICHESTKARSDPLEADPSCFRVFVATCSAGRNHHNATATTRLIEARATNDAAQLASAATSPATARPVKPPTIVPVMYAAVPRPPCEGGQTS
jgi:hypothetical protein